MKTTLVAFVVAGVCSVAAAQSIYFNRSCGSGFGFSYAGNGFAISYGTYCPQLLSCGRPWSAGYYCAPAVPVNYYCGPAQVYVNPCAYPVQASACTFHPARPIVANPVFPVRDAASTLPSHRRQPLTTR